MSSWLWILVVLVAVVASVVATALIVRRNDARKVSFMMDALEDGETNFRFVRFVNQKPVRLDMTFMQAFVFAA